MILSLNKQVVSLEIAKKLRELGVEQDSYFHHYQGIGGIWYLGDTTEMMNGAVDIGRTTAPQFNSCSAFTESELMELLPESIESGLYLNVVKYMEKYLVCYGIGSTQKHRQIHETPADALGLMLIHLSENKLITL